MSLQIPPRDSPPDKNCVRPAAPGNDNLTYDEPHQLRPKWGYAGNHRKAASKTRLSTLDTMDRRRARGVVGATYTSGDSAEFRGERSHADDLNLPLVLEKAAVKERAQK